MSKIWLKNYEPNVPHSIDLTAYKSLSDLLEKNFESFADRPAFSCFGKSLTYEQIKEHSDNFAAYLQNTLRLEKGDRVALMMPNILQYPVALFGAIKAGMIVVNVNPLYTPTELEHQLKDSQAKCMVVLSNFAHTVEKVLPNVPLEHVIVTNMGDLLDFPKSLVVDLVVKHVKKMVPEFNITKALTFKQVLKEGNKLGLDPVDLNQEDVAFFQYTGGTTGVSKGAVLTHGNIIANILQAKAWLTNILSGHETRPQEIIITPLPLYHIFSLTANCFIYSSIGALNVLITNPRDIPAFVKELKNWKFTAFTGLNTLFNALVNNTDFKDLDFSHLRITLGGGMAVHQAVAEKWKQVTKVPIIEAYGLTETSPAACVNPLNLESFNGFVGLPIPDTEVSIRNDDFQEVALGEVGEICIKGPQVMRGYHNQPEETKKVLQDSWLKTGDLGFMNSEGFVKIIDRKKDMIIVSGFNVYPNEIEDVVVKHPKVLEAAVIGIKDEVKGENIKLFVVKKDPSLSAEEILAFCRQHLTAYKIPKSVEFRSELPKSNVGKILRKNLRDEK